jgi:hypothetical protein
MSGHECIGLLALGCVPYSIVRRQKSSERTFEIRALYWSFARQIDARGNQQWDIRLPVIERLRGAIWAVIEHLRKDSGVDE